MSITDIHLLARSLNMSLDPIEYEANVYECVSDVVDELKEQRMPDGTTEFVGQVLLDWVS